MNSWKKLSEPLKCRVLQCSHFSSKSLPLGLKRPFFVSAPMVHHSELAWRLLVKQNDIDLACTQMINSKTFANSGKYRRETMDWIDYSHISNALEATTVAQNLDTNCIVQLAGDNPSILVAAGKQIQTSNNVVGIDINFGCPQAIARKGHYGAYLLYEPMLIESILTAMVKELNSPVTAKIRLLPNLQDTLDLVKMIESCGVSMLTVHGRTITQNKQYCEEANWETIGLIKQSIGIPVIANGGIENYRSVLKCSEITQADGIMSSEALLENPKLFTQQGSDSFEHHYSRTQLATVREYIDLCTEYRTHFTHKTPLSEPPQTLQEARHNKYASNMISHLFKLLYRFLSAEKNRDLQAKLNVFHEHHDTTFKALLSFCDEIDDRMSKINYDDKRAITEGLLSESSWYRRYRKDKTVETHQSK